MSSLSGHFFLLDCEVFYGWYWARILTRGRQPGDADADGHSAAAAVPRASTPLLRINMKKKNCRWPSMFGCWRIGAAARGAAVAARAERGQGSSREEAGARAAGVGAQFFDKVRTYSHHCASGRAAEFDSHRFIAINGWAANAGFGGPEREDARPSRWADARRRRAPASGLARPRSAGDRSLRTPSAAACTVAALVGDQFLARGDRPLVSGRRSLIP